MNNILVSSDPVNLSKRLVTRRDFVRSTASATFAAVTLPTIVPASVFGKDGAVAPSNRLVVGVIGCGPRSLGVLSGFLNERDCQVVAVCDVKADRLQSARTAVNQHYQNSDCRTYHDFRELLARKDIDACLIATPDHWHVLVALAAVNSGKDIYLEKPMGLSLEECQVLRSAVRKQQRVFQFGTQQRSERTFRFAAELARNGALGKLQHINVWAPGSTPGGSIKEVPPPAGLDYDFWLGPAPFKPYTEDRCSADDTKKTWWFTSDYALGFIAGWGIHPMDIAAWGGGELIGGTVTVEGRGNFRLADGICDTASIWDVDYRFASGVTMKFVGVPHSKTSGEPFLHEDEWKQRYRQITSHGTAFEGSDGWAEVHRGGMNLQPEDLAERNPDEFKLKLTRSSGHARNFLDCVKSRAETVCPIDAAVKSEILCHIADIAIRLGRKVTFDFGKERFVNDDSANQRLKARPMRKPWHL